MTSSKRLIECISPSHGRALIYVWAIEQDELSKRDIPLASGSQSDEVAEQDSRGSGGQDVFVPWVLSPQTPPRTRPKGKARRKPQAELTEEAPAPPDTQTEKKVLNRFYHMFAQGELLQLVCDAATDMGLTVKFSDKDLFAGEDQSGVRGIEIMQDGWERSNYYIELRRWET